MFRVLIATVLWSGISLAYGADPSRAPTVPPRIFTAAQASAGKVAYESSCGLCHQFNLQGRSGAPGERPDVNTLPDNMIRTIDQNGGQVPPLVGPRFMARWGAKSTTEYVARVATAIQGFPPTNAGEDTALLLTAYFLQMNGAKAGTIPLGPATRVSLFEATGKGAAGQELETHR